MGELDGERGKRKDKWERYRRDDGMKSAVRGRVSECGCGYVTAVTRERLAQTKFSGETGRVKL